MRRHKLFGIWIAALVVALAGAVLAKSVTITIPMQDVVVKSQERGNCYVVTIDLPKDLEGKRLDSVLLDFVVDASPKSEAEEGETPMVAVFPLTEAATGAALKYESKVPSVRPVPMGKDQQVTVDITDIVKGWLANPLSNHGLVIGTLTGPGVGTVSLQSTALGPSTAVRVTFFYQNRSGERVSQK